jgi:ABC-2 type transport system permease protein
MRLFIHIYKEILILIRDKAGLAVLYLMPLSLIVLMTIIQDAPFRDYKNANIPVLFVNNDQDSLSALILERLKEAEMFSLVETDFTKYSPVEIKELVESGKYKAAIILPENTTKEVEKKLKIRLEKSFNSFSPVKSKFPNKETEQGRIEIIWDPITKKSFKDGLSMALEKILISYQANKMIKDVEKRLQIISGDKNLIIEDSPLVAVNNVASSEPDFALSGLNSVQHNVPAWSIFGIFFMIIPLAGNLIKEREQKTILRLHLIPSSLPFALGGKILTYLLVACTQFVLVVLAGKFLLPLLGLPVLYTGNNIAAMSLVVVSLGLSAAGYGVLVGTVFNTIHQASTFGAVSIVILAAIGGIWIPIFVMPKAIQLLSIVSPLAWGMEAFNNIFLRGGGLKTIFPQVVKLVFVAIAMFYISFLLEKRK